MKVCRLCLSKLQRGSKYFNINAVESFTGFMPYRDQLTTCIPEMALDLIPNPVICNTCRTALKSSYDFKSRCLLIEKKIREYVEVQPSEITTYDLNEIDISDIPKLNTKFAAMPEPHSISEVPQMNRTYSKLSELLTINKEVILPFPNKELEITNITQNYTANVSGEDNNFDINSCNACMMKFENVAVLHQHKKDVHNEDYICNFCNEAFRSLQCLRKHNYDCMKNKSPASRTTVLAKRPHLPTKAKNHLKRWLFRHTDHPYPTDHEKQQLMKETNLSLLQVENWFINARRRILADLTKLKNMRGRHIKRKRQERDHDEECEDLLETEPERLLEESFLFENETNSGPKQRIRSVRGRRRRPPILRPIITPKKELPEEEDEEAGEEEAAEGEEEVPQEALKEKEEENAAEEQTKQKFLVNTKQEPVDEEEEEPTEGEEEEDELLSSSQIKMEVDIDER